MKKQLLSLIASATIFSTAATTVLAEQIDIQKNEPLLDFPNQYGVSNNIWSNLSNNIIDPFDIFTETKINHLLKKAEDTLWKSTPDFEFSTEDIKKQNQLTPDLINTGLQQMFNMNLPNEIKETINENKQNVQTANGKKAETTKATDTAPFRSESTENGNTIKKKIQTNTSPTEAVNTENVQNNPVPDEFEVKENANTNDQNVPDDQAPAETDTSEPEGKEITVTATAYTAECDGCSGITKTGVNLEANPDAKIIAVDPTVIPLGSKVHVEGYGYATAEDIGGGIDGNEIDVFVPDQDDALDWGRKQVKVTVID